MFHKLYLLSWNTRQVCHPDLNIDTLLALIYTLLFKGQVLFPTDDSLLKMLYLAMMDITKKWTEHRQDCGQIHFQREIYFEERLSGRYL